MPSTQGERRLGLRLNISGFLLGLGTSSILYIIPIFLERLGASYTEIGLVGSVRASPYAFLPIAAGYLSERLDKTRLYLLSVIFAAVASALLYLARTVPEIAAANLLLGLHMVFYWPIAESIIAEALPESIRWGAYTRFSVAWSSAYFIGPSFGGLLADLLGIRYSFLAGALISASAAPIILSMGRLQPSVEKSRRKPQLRKILTIWPIYLSVFIFTIGLSSLFVLAPSYFSSLGWSMTGIGVLFTVFGVARAASYLVMSRSGRLPAVPLLLLATVIQAVSLLLLANGNPFILALSLLLAGAVNGVYFTSSFDLLSSSIPGGLKGVAIGFFEAVLGVGFIVGPAASGSAMDFLGGSRTFQLLAVVALFGAPLGFILRGKTGSEWSGLR